MCTQWGLPLNVPDYCTQRLCRFFFWLFSQKVKLFLQVWTSCYGRVCIKMGRQLEWLSIWFSLCSRSQWCQLSRCGNVMTNFSRFTLVRAIQCGDQVMCKQLQRLKVRWRCPRQTSSMKTLSRKEKKRQATVKIAAFLIRHLQFKSIWWGTAVDQLATCTLTLWFLSLTRIPSHTNQDFPAPSTIRVSKRESLWTRTNT